MSLVDADAFLLEKTILEVDGEKWAAQEMKWGHRRDGLIEIRFYTMRYGDEMCEVYPGLFFMETVARPFYRTVLIESMEADTPAPKIDTNLLTRLLREAKETRP